MMRLLSPRRPVQRRSPPSFVPRLETLEDRSLPSAVPSVTFASGMIVQTLVQTAPAVDVVLPEQSFQGTASESVSVLVEAANVNSPSLVGVPTTLSFSAAGSAFISSRVTSVADGVLYNVDVSLQLHSSTAFGQQPAASFSVQISQNTVATGTVLSLTILAQDATQNATSGYQGQLQFGYAAMALAGTALGSSGAPAGPSTNQAYAFTNPMGGGSSITVDIPGSLVPSQTAANAAFLVESGSPLFTPWEAWRQLDNTQTPAAPDISTGYTIAGPNSLVLGEVTFSINQEIQQRSVNFAAQITWTGMQPPAEAPLRETPFWKSQAGMQINQDLGQSTVLFLNTLAPLADNPDPRPMEKMVARVLRSLEQAKKDDPERATSQTAALSGPPLALVPWPNPGNEPGWDDATSMPLAYWPWERLDPSSENLSGAGLSSLPPNGLERSPAGEQGEIVQSGRTTDQNEEALQQSPEAPSRASLWQWIRRLGMVAGLCLASGWPTAVWFGQSNPWKLRGRPKNTCHSL